jgi:hypothetical protein
MRPAKTEPGLAFDRRHKAKNHVRLLPRPAHEGWKRPMSRHDGRKLCVDVVPILEALSRTRFDDRPPEGGKA